MEHLENLKRAAKEFKDKITKNPLQRTLSEATSNDNWQAPTKVLQTIADATYNYVEFSEVTKHIWKKLNSKNKNWRKILKTLNLIEYLLKNGAPRCISEFKDEIFQIRTMLDFTHFENNIDRGQSIREKTKQVIDMLTNDQLLDEERDKAKKIRERLSNMGQMSSASSQSYQNQDDNYYNSDNASKDKQDKYGFTDVEYQPQEKKYENYYQEKETKPQIKKPYVPNPNSIRNQQQAQQSSQIQSLNSVSQQANAFGSETQQQNQQQAAAQPNFAGFDNWQNNQQKNNNQQKPEDIFSNWGALPQPIQKKQDIWDVQQQQPQQTQQVQQQQQFQNEWNWKQPQQNNQQSTQNQVNIQSQQQPKQQQQVQQPQQIPQQPPSNQQQTNLMNQQQFQQKQQQVNTLNLLSDIDFSSTTATQVQPQVQQLQVQQQQIQSQQKIIGLQQPQQQQIIQQTTITTPINNQQIQQQPPTEKQEQKSQLTNFTDLEANLISLSDLKKEESNKKGDSKNKDFNQSPNQQQGQRLLLTTKEELDNFALFGQPNIQPINQTSFVPQLNMQPPQYINPLIPNMQNPMMYNSNQNMMNQQMNYMNANPYANNYGAMNIMQSGQYNSTYVSGYNMNANQLNNMNFGKKI